MVVMVICDSFDIPFFSSLDIYLSSKIFKGIKTSNCACDASCYGDDVYRSKNKVDEIGSSVQFIFWMN